MNLDLTGALLHNARFAAADLRGSDLSTLDPTAVDLKGALITWKQAVQVAKTLGLNVRPD